MMEYFAIAGLSLVIVAWIIQLIGTWHGDRQIRKWFVFVYMLGVIFLVANGFKSGITNTGFLNLISLLVSIAVFIRLIEPKSHKKTKK